MDAGELVEWLLRPQRQHERLLELAEKGSVPARGSVREARSLVSKKDPYQPELGYPPADGRSSRRGHRLGRTGCASRSIG